jgi:hypothetical protein
MVPLLLLLLRPPASRLHLVLCMALLQLLLLRAPMAQLLLKQLRLLQ